jgi:flagellar hook-associated protein 3 FlgL
MRIASNAFYQRNQDAMSRLSSRADTLQTQIATSKRFSAPSEAAGAWRQLTGLRRAGADSAADAANITRASTLLSASDTALGAIGDRLQQAREIAIQANTGTLTAQQRAALAESIDAIREDVLRLANSQDTDGRPLFGGANGDVAYARTGGAVAYAGSGEPGAIPIGEGAEVHATTPGPRILADSLRSEEPVGPAVDDLKTALDSVAIARASIGARGARLDLEGERLDTAAIAREETRSALEETDIGMAVTELQKTLTVLQATQASFTKLSSLSLFDMLR